MGGLGTVPWVADALEIDVPLDLRSLRAVRLAALDAASRAGLDVPAANALQAGMDELCVAVVEAATGAGRLVVRLRSRAGEVSARGVARLDHDHPSVLLGRLARSILAASVDDYTIVDETDLVCFEVWKRANGER